MYICIALLIKQVTIMKTKNLFFEKALVILFEWDPVCYSNIHNGSVTLEVPMLHNSDIVKLAEFSDWFISANYFNSFVKVILYSPYE